MADILQISTNVFLRWKISYFDAHSFSTRRPIGSIDNKQVLRHVIAWRWIGAKWLPEPMLTLFTGADLLH